MTDNIIYDDAIGSGWASYSSSNFDLNNTEANTVKVGTKSIKAMPTGAYEYFLANTSTTLSPSNYPAGIGFWALGTTTNGTNTAVRIKVQTKTAGGSSSTEKQVDLPVGVWTYVNATWADLGNPSEIKEVVIQDLSGAGGQLFYLDEIKLLAQLPTYVADVTFSPAGGTYTSAQSISLATTTAGASIRYTTDGTTPTETIGTVYTTPIAVSATTTIKAIAYKSGSTSSAVTSATYTINIALTDNIIYDDAIGSGWASDSSSSFDLNNTAANSVKIGTKSIKAMPTGAYEYFLANTATTLSPSIYPAGIGFWALGTTTNGTNTAVRIKVQTKTAGGSSSTEKQVDLPVGVWTYVNATWADLGNPSEIKEVVIQDLSGAGGQLFYLDEIKLLAQLPTYVADVTFSPAGGTYTSAQSISLATTTAGASIRYTTDGTTPTETIGTVYTTPIAVSATTTIKAIAYKSGSTSSAVTSATYTINIPVVSDVTFSLAGSTFTAPTKGKIIYHYYWSNDSLHN